MKFINKYLIIKNVQITLKKDKELCNLFISDANKIPSEVHMHKIDEGNK